MDEICSVALSDGDAGQLAAVREPHIGLTVWRRPLPVSVLADDLMGFAEVRFESDIDMVAETLLAAFIDQKRADWHAAVAADAALLATIIADVAKRRRVRVRLEPVSGNACRKFHADYVTVRLLTTYVGPGTEWLIDGEDDPVIHRLSAGDVGLFKGRLWAPHPRLLHRSPPIEGTGDRRLLLVVDPLEDEG